VDARTLTKLRRGQLQVEATLDLHGMSQQGAHGALMHFLAAQQARGVRRVRVVTGRGLKADWSPGVLRAAVPRWLNEPPLRALVLAFAYARADDGGAGALYVLLRRRR
jgi:DNA-nicking Smr family endonuclease